MKVAQKTAWGLVLALAAAGVDAEISDKEIRIGLITDMTSVYREIGRGSDIAAEMAIEDVGGAIDGNKIRLYVRDHQVDTERAMAQAKDLHENEQVDVFLDMSSTDVSIEVQHYARENNVLAIHTGTASSILTGEECSPLGVHWIYDTYALAGGTAAATIAQGADTWYFVTVDYTFGKNLEADAATVVERNGGKVLGSALHPIKAADVTPQLQEAAASGAKVIALANAGRDTTRAIRQAYELGIGQSDDQMLVGLLVMDSAVEQLGYYVAKGLKLTHAFYWNYDDKTRAWAERFRARAGKPPAMFHAGVYSALMHYFKAIELTGSDDPATVIAKMRELPVEDFFSRNGRLREDGRMVHDMYLLEVKGPQDVEAVGDHYKMLRVIPGDQAFRPIEEGGCPYLTQK